MALALVGCSNPGAAKKTTPKLTSGAQVVGSLLVPAGVIASGAGNLISTNGGNVIASGAGNVIASGAGNYRLAAVSGKGMAGIRIQLVDAARKPLPGVPATTTDAAGHYTLTGVTPGTYLVLASTETSDHHAAPMLTVVKVGTAGATADVDIATTFVTVAVTEGSNTGLVGVDPTAASFRNATSAMAKGLTDADVATLADTAGILARVAELAAQVAEIKEGMAALGQQVADLEAKLAELEKQLGTSQGAGDAVNAPFTVPTKAAVFAGGGAGFKDGAGNQAQFAEPWSPCLDSQGSLVLADPPNHAIRAIASDGGVSTLVGGPSQAGYKDDLVAKALLGTPVGIAADIGPHRAYFIADQLNHVLRGLDLQADGGARLVTAAGTGQEGTNDEGDPGPATMKAPSAVAVARDGTVYLTDQGGHNLRYLRGGALRTAVLTPAAGVDAADVALTNPSGIATRTGNPVFIADATRNVVLRLTQSDAPLHYTVDLLGGGAGTFKAPAGLAVASDGSVLVAETGAHRVSVVDPKTGARKKTLGGADDDRIPADFGEVTGVAVGAGGTLYVTDRTAARVWKVSP